MTLQRPAAPAAAVAATSPSEYDGQDDRALVARVTEGDGGALEALYARYGRACYGLARRILVDEQLAQDAVQEVEGRRAVFVPGDRPGEFRAQPVEVGETLDGGRVAIRSGLAAGARLVVSGAFALRSELAKGEFGEHGH